MSTYSTRLAQGQVSVSGSTIFTAPANAVTVVRDVELWNSGSAANLVFLGVYVSGPLEGVFAGVNSLAPSTPYQWEGRVVLNPGDELKLNFGGGPWFVLVSGYVLSP